MVIILLLTGILLIQGRATCMLIGEAANSTMREYPETCPRIFHVLLWLGWLTVLIAGIIGAGWIGLLMPVYVRIAGWAIEKWLLMLVKLLTRG